MKFITALILSVMLLITTAVAADNYVAKNLAQAQFTTYVNKRVPIDNIVQLGSNVKKIYFFTDVRDCTKCKIEHQWWYKGEKVSSVKGKTSGARYRWWSNKTLTSDMTGEWTVKVYVSGRKVYTKSFNYYTPSKEQKQTAPIKQRVLIEEANECEIQLRYWNDKIHDEPENDYYKFMSKKWFKRCQ